MNIVLAVCRTCAHSSSQQARDRDRACIRDSATTAPSQDWPEASKTEAEAEAAAAAAFAAVGAAAAAVATTSLSAVCTCRSEKRDSHPLGVQAPWKLKKT